MKQYLIILSLVSLIATAVTVPAQDPPVIEPAVASEQLIEVEPVEPEPEIKEPELTEEQLRKKLITDNPQQCTDDQLILWPDGECKDQAKPSQTISTPGPVNPVGCDNYRHLVEQYDWNVSTMMYAMQKESSCNPNAVGDNYVIGDIYAPSCGLLQVRTLPGRPSCAALKDPATNVATAYQIWKGQGYRAWTVLH